MIVLDRYRKTYGPHGLLRVPTRMMGVRPQTNLSKWGNAAFVREYGYPSREQIKMRCAVKRFIGEV